MAESERAHKPRESSKAPKPPEKKAPEQAPPVAQRMPGWLGARAPAGAPFPLGGVQRKVAIGASNDAYERQADQVASHVTSGQRVPPGTISPIAPVSLGGAQRQSKPEEKKKEEKPAAPMQRAVRPEDTKKDIKSAGAQLQRAAKPEDKKKDEKPASPAPVQKQAKPEEKKKDEKPAAPPPVQKQAKPDEKKKDEKPAAAAPVQKQAKPEEKKKDEKPAAAAPVQKQAKPDEKKKDEKPAAAAPVQKQDKPEEKKKDEKPAAAPVQRSVRPEDEKKEEVSGTLPVQRAGVDQAAKKEEEPVQASRGGGNAPAAPSMESAASNAIASKGPGEPLNSSTRGTLESRMGTDLNDVRVHNDSRAHEAANALNARAFTHQNDIWLGRGESQADTQLMAHEATHVVQQTGSVHRQLVQRDDKPAAGGTPPATDATQAAGAKPDTGTVDNKDGKKDITIPTVALPKFKAERHAALYAGDLVVPTEERDTNQIKVWNEEVKDAVGGKLDDKLNGKESVKSPTSAKDIYFLKSKSADFYVFGSKEAIKSEVSIPYWDPQGKQRAMQVDHMKEFQLGGKDIFDNMELLDATANASSGSVIRGEIEKKVSAAVRPYTGPQSGDKKVWDKEPDLKQLRAEKWNIKFLGFTSGLSVTGQPDMFWEGKKIKGGEHLDKLEALSASQIEQAGLRGSPTELVVFSSQRAGTPRRIPWPQGAGATHTVTIKDFYPGFNLTEVLYTPQEKEGEQVGLITGDLFKDNKVIDGEHVTWTLRKTPGIGYGGYIDEDSIKAAIAKGIALKAMSPIEFSEARLDSTKGLYAVGQVLPTVPLFRNIGIDLVVEGGDIRLRKLFRSTDFSFPGPLKVTESSLELSAGIKSGLGVSGDVQFDIDRVGKGKLGGGKSMSEGFHIEGEFIFDKKLFDDATVKVWYRSEKFGGKGHISIGDGKVTGIQSASLDAEFDDDKISATGSVKPKIPAVEQADLKLNYDPKIGLTIGGDLQLKKDIPGIAGGSIHAEVNKKEDKYTVKASGEATPKIPGISSKLTVTYDDGAFDATVTAGFEKGMLKGTVTAGATNRPVGDDGKPAGEAPAGKAEKITLYGGGSATLKLAPWLQATAAIKFKPNGEVEVTGKIGLPSAIDIFDEKKVEKNIFKIGIDIPIFPGISLAVGGGLDLNAGIGPAQLQEVDLSVTYNPDHEDETNVHGHAALHIPAHAGLRMNVHAGLAVGIPLAKIEGGIELGGTMGIEGALHAGVDIDWTPKKGLVLDASAEVYAEPKLKFDIAGYVLVEVGIGWLSKTLWEKKWQLAAVEYGSGLRLGLKLPIHYEEGKPFNVSLSDIQFTVPDVDPMSVLKGLMDKIL